MFEAFIQDLVGEVSTIGTSIGRLEEVGCNTWYTGFLPTG